MGGRRLWLAATAAIVALLARAPAGTSGAGPAVVRASLEGEINPATSAYIARAVGRAESERAAALVVVLNTPGGVSSSMDEMVTALLNARVPVVAYVAPAGARADSAGLFVAQAADLVAMAPGTNVGSAHPIDVSGANIGGELEQKVVNDAVARARTLALIHGRNADWCEQAVRQSVNVTADQAVSLHVADLEAKDLPALLAAIDGRSLPRPHASPLTLRLAGAAVEDDPMPWPLGLLQVLMDPDVAYLLLLLAIFGLIGEVTMPGAIVPGTVGGISAVLALVALVSLPINVAGAILVLFAFVLFALDVKAPTHGVLTAGGIVSLVLGSSFLVETGPLGVGVSLPLIAGAAIACAAFFGLVVGKAVAARRRPPYDVLAPPAHERRGRAEGTG